MQDEVRLIVSGHDLQRVLPKVASFADLEVDEIGAAEAALAEIEEWLAKNVREESVFGV